MPSPQKLAEIRVTRLFGGSLKKLLLLTSLCLSGCATIVGGDSQLIFIDASVKDAEIFYNGSRIGLTPFTGMIKKSREPQIMVKKEGYEVHTQVLSTTVPTIFWGNILIGGVFGSTTDFVTEAMFEVSPKNYYINLRPIGKSTFNFEKDTEIKKYVMVNYNHLRNEINRNEAKGEYILGLRKLFVDSKNKETEKIIIILKDESLGPIQSGEAIAALYR